MGFLDFIFGSVKRVAPPEIEHPTDSVCALATGPYLSRKEADDAWEDASYVFRGMASEIPKGELRWVDFRNWSGDGFVCLCGSAGLFGFMDSGGHIYQSIVGERKLICIDCGKVIQAESDMIDGKWIAYNPNRSEALHRCEEEMPGSALESIRTVLFDSNLSSGMKESMLKMLSGF